MVRLTAGNYKSAGLPNITGGSRTDSNYQVWAVDNTSSSPHQNGAFTQGNVSYKGATGGSGGYRPLSFDASLSNAVYGNSDTVQPKSVTVMYFIKY